MTTPTAIQNLYDQYPLIIEQMKSHFNAHQFILQLAHENQVDYINALSIYTDHLRRGQPAPFMMLHGILAQRLRDLHELVRYAGIDENSHDIFEQPQSCSLWEKL
jgi:hypothetical protein